MSGRGEEEGGMEERDGGGAGVRMQRKEGVGTETYLIAHDGRLEPGMRLVLGGSGGWWRVVKSSMKCNGMKGLRRLACGTSRNCAKGVLVCVADGVWS